MIRGRRLGCDAEPTIYVNNKLSGQTGWKVTQSSTSQGSWCMADCGGSGSCPKKYHSETNLDCALNTISVNNDGGCAGSVGSVTLVPTNDPDTNFAAETGLTNIVLNWDDSGGNHAGTNKYWFQFNGPLDKGYQFGVEDGTFSGSPRDGSAQMTIDYTATPAPHTAPPTLAPTPSPAVFDSYQGQWTYIGDFSQISASASFTSTASMTEADQTSFQSQFSLSDSVKFGVPGFADDKLSGSAQATMGNQITNTFSSGVTVTESVSCTTECTEDYPNIFQWQSIGASTVGGKYTLDSCIFACLNETYSAIGPLCPVQYCGEENCQCCNDCWIDGNYDAADNRLCPGVTCKTPAPTPAPAPTQDTLQSDGKTTTSSADSSYWNSMMRSFVLGGMALWMAAS